MINAKNIEKIVKRIKVFNNFLVLHDKEVNRLKGKKNLSSIGI